MRFELRTAALSPEMERRVRLAARTLTAHHIDARVEPWEGWRCAAVVLDSADAYGRRVSELATRHQVPVIGIGADGADAHVRALPADASVTVLARTLLGVCVPEQAAPDATSASTRGAAPQPAPAGEARESASAGVFEALARTQPDDDVELRSGTRAVYLLKSRGRVLARSLSDILLTRDRLGDGTVSWRTLAKGEAPPAGVEVASSLDAFLTGAALRHADGLPAYPERACALADWPDLGSAPDAVEALQLAGRLLRRAATPSVAAAATSLPQRTVSALYWAYAAGGLFTDAGPAFAAVAAPKPRPDGLLARLAAHFGLGRRNPD